MTMETIPASSACAYLLVAAERKSAVCAGTKFRVSELCSAPAA